ncbi:MAG: L,D-transpeptidase family protein [Ignavibacterium sp.]|jgi:murein L,D-transpeptidase YcbB/YkuD|nr:L,D-transpeptidase family protein [Ignavibacterium sp.]
MTKNIGKRNIHFVIIIILILFTLPFLSCDNKAPEQSIDEKLGFDPKLFEQNLKDALIFNSWIKAGNINVESIDTLESLYASKNYKALLINSLESKPIIDSIIDIIGKAELHGLNPERYNFSIIKNLFESSFNAALNPEQRIKQLAQSEVLLIDAIIKFSTDMRHGVLNPRILYEKTHFLPVNDSLNTKYLEPVKQNNILAYLKNIQPKSVIYKNLQQSLLKFKQMESLEWKQIPLTDKKIEVGQSSENIPAIYNKLVDLGLLDTALYKTNDPTVYDSVLANSVKIFQKINGLANDGVIGKGTIERFNITPKQYVEKIKLNLERLRWSDYSDTAKYIFVNIPDFSVTAVENQKPLFEIKACTGRKNNWQTVTLYGQLSYFVLNPTWSVPRSIIKEEIVNGLRNDSSYLKKRNFRVYKAGERIDLDGLTAKDLSSSNSYTLIQDPGAGNALGKIKFMFTNPFGIYLHDTPTRAPFGYVNRAVSHGCVRVEKPMKLAEYLLNNNSNWNLDFLKIEIGQKVDDPMTKNEFARVRDSLRKGNSYGVTTEVKLTKKIPLFIDYYTTWVDEDGFFNYRDDVYSRDAILLENLKPAMSK